MSNGFDNDYDSRLIGNGEENENEKALMKQEETEEYYDLPPAIRSRTLIWSVISLICGALSLVLCPFYYVGFAFALCALAFSVISRHNLGFFEKYSIIGIVLGAMGFVASVFSLVADLVGLF